MPNAMTIHLYRAAPAEPGAEPAAVWCIECNRTPAEHADENEREARCALLGHDFDVASPGVVVCDDCKLVRESENEGGA